MLIVIIIAAIVLTAITANIASGTGSCTDHYSAYYRSMEKLTGKQR